MFSDGFTILTSVNSLAVKVVFSSHVDSTSSGQHFVGLDLIIACSSSASVEQRLCRLCDTGGTAGRAGITIASIVTFERVKPTTFLIFSSKNSAKPLHKISSFMILNAGFKMVYFAVINMHNHIIYVIVLKK